MTENERDRIKALEVQMAHHMQEQGNIKNLVLELVADMHRRRGKEEAEGREHIEGREDKFQRGQWVRALLPLGLLTALFTAIWNQIWAFITGATP
jgi:hypothetical protein